MMAVSVYVWSGTPAGDVIVATDDGAGDSAQRAAHRADAHVANLKVYLRVVVVDGPA